MSVYLPPEADEWGFEARRYALSEANRVVDIREEACDCDDYRYRMGPADGRCKHLRFIKGIAAGDLCPHCGYETCRPSCIGRTTETETATQ